MISMSNKGTSKSQSGNTLARTLLKFKLHLAAGRIMRMIGSAEVVTFVRGRGNVGDRFIELGIRQLLRDRRVKEVDGAQLGNHRGEIAVIAGGGAWCESYHAFMPDLLAKIEERFSRVIVLPSSFDVAVPEVKTALSRTQATIFAREKISYRAISTICSSTCLAHDCAFYAEIPQVSPAKFKLLNAFRTDRESLLLRTHDCLPENNIDVSVSNGDVGQWLAVIGEYELIKTDRAHVMIAAALLGRRVEYYPSNYHKLDGIAEHSLRGFPVSRMDSNSLKPNN
jgi:exopolysaccharide biosynthesis predicted pyruvyltransferase EpsI